MSLPAVRAALEATLAAISPALPTAWQNVKYIPTPGQAYQRVHLLLAPPANREIGPGYTEQGFMQVALLYPIGTGFTEQEARAELIRAAFPFASTHLSGSERVLITATPEIAPAEPEDDFAKTIVRIRFEAHHAGG